VGCQWLPGAVVLGGTGAVSGIHGYETAASECPASVQECKYRACARKIGAN